VAPSAQPVPPLADTPEKRKARLDGIRKLIQLACSKEGDGREAAWRACALIRKFGLDIIDPELLDAVYKENHALKQLVETTRPKPSRWDPDEDDDFIDPLSWQSGWAGLSGSRHPGATPTAPRQPPRPTPQPVPPAPPPPQPPPSWATQGAGAPMTAPIFIQQSKFAGKCKHCGKVINVGDPVRWMKSTGVWCPTTSCYNDWVNGVTQAANFNPFGP
jgi:hypothetical protein